MFSSFIQKNEENTTNNRMELLAIIRALQYVKTCNSNKVTLRTDSKYAINGIEKWLINWKKKGWQNSQGEEVKNKDLWLLVDEAIKSINNQIYLEHVRGHIGIVGNERADQIATSFAKRESFSLYEGPYNEYSYDLINIKPNILADKRKSSSKQRSKKKSLYYLSLVNGKLERHSSWEECAARVKGVSNAKYKKISTPLESKETLKAWGLDSKSSNY